LLNFKEKIEGNSDKYDPSYEKYVRIAVQSECDVVLLNSNGLNLETDKPSGNNPKTIDAWWQNDDTSRLMLLLAYLIKQSKRGCINL
jgi:hypothetical protein